MDASAATDEVFRGFIVAESAALLRTAWMLTGQRELAEDLLQTALVKAWPHWERISRDGTPAAYVRTVMIRTYASALGRRWRGEIPWESVPDGVAPGDVFAAADERDRLLRALATLPRKQRAVVVLRYYHDLSERQVADSLGCSIGTVKTHASRGLARLRQATREEPVREEETR